jgi:hypothetical protein
MAGRRVRAAVAVAALAAGAGCAIPGRPALSDRDVIRTILDSSVQIVLERGGDRFRTGSGVVVGSRPREPAPDCYVLTSGHTLAGVRNGDGRDVYALFDRHRGPGRRARAEIVAQREAGQVDLALLRVQLPACPPAALGRPPTLGDRIWIVGFPWGRQLRLVSGIVSQVALDDGGGGAGVGATSLMVDASVAYGMSGAGVFDAATGRLVGLIEGYGTARVPFGEKPALQYIDVPVPGETYVTSLETIERFLRESARIDVRTPGG